MKGDNDVATLNLGALMQFAASLDRRIDQQDVLMSALGFGLAELTKQHATEGDLAVFAHYFIEEMNHA